MQVGLIDSITPIANAPTCPTLQGGRQQLRVVPYHLLLGCMGVAQITYTSQHQGQEEGGAARERMGIRRPKQQQLEGEDSPHMHSGPAKGRGEFEIAFWGHAK